MLCWPPSGIDYSVKTLTLDNTQVAMQLWDTAGQERSVSFFFLLSCNTVVQLSECYKNIMCFLMVQELLKQSFSSSASFKWYLKVAHFTN